MIGVVGWVVLAGLLLAWEALSIALDRPGWPSTSDMFRAATRPVAGRWVLFAAWLWLGWHVFMRGWSFFLAGPGARTPPRSSRSAGQFFTQVILPLLAAYAGWLGFVAGGRRERMRHTPQAAVDRAGASTGGRLRHLAVTVAGGYVAFVAAIGAYAIVSGELAKGAFGEAVRQGAFLAFAVAVPVFGLGVVVQAARRRHRPVKRLGPP